MAESGALTWRDLLADARRRVGEDPAARWLCQVASGTDDLNAIAAEIPTDRMVAHLDAMLARHRDGEPLAYVLGRWSFRHLDLAVDRRVLIPRPETEVVAGAAIDLARTLPPPITVADLHADVVDTRQRSRAVRRRASRIRFVATSAQEQPDDGEGRNGDETAVHAPPSH